MIDTTENILGTAELTEKLDSLLSRDKAWVIAIDGRAASGKTTLAEFLAKKYGAAVVHTDDFYLPFDMRTYERLSTPGGNVHYERLKAEVIDKIGKTSAIEYGVFDCSCGEINKTRTVSATGPLIVEGAYALHPKLGKYYDLSVFMTADESLRLRRVRKRDGDTKAAVFAERWFPLEECYIKEYNIQSEADIVLYADSTD